MPNVDVKDICQYCNSEETVIAKRVPRTYFSDELEPVEKLGFFKETPTQTINYVVCLNCGTIIRTFVQEPQKLVLKKK